MTARYERPHPFVRRLHSTAAVAIAKWDCARLRWAARQKLVEVSLREFVHCVDSLRDEFERDPNARAAFVRECAESLFVIERFVRAAGAPHVWHNHQLKGGEGTRWRAVVDEVDRAIRIDAQALGERMNARLAEERRRRKAEAVRNRTGGDRHDD